MAILLLGNVDFVESEGTDLEVKGNNGMDSFFFYLNEEG